MPRYSINELVTITGMSTNTIHKRLIHMTPVKQGAAKTYETKEVLPILYGAGGGTAVTAADQKARLLLHQANIAELKEKEIRRELIPKEEVEAFVGDGIKRARSRLLPLGGVVQDQITAISQIKTVINREIRAALDELSGTSSY